MYQTLTFYHSIVRWLVLISLLYSIIRAWKGYASGKTFSKTDNSVRHWTATIAHVQLVIGILLYTQSPLIKYFWKNFKDGIRDTDASFFGLFHILMMLLAIVLITVGSAKTKRRVADINKFRTMLTWFSMALIIILMAVPWPFSPFVARPYFR